MQKQPLEKFCKKAVLKHFAIFTRKHLSWRLFLIQNILKFFRAPMLKNICEWLLLKMFIIKIRKVKNCWQGVLTRYTGIPGLWAQELDAELWTLDSGRWSLDATLWTLGSEHWTLSLTVVEQNHNPVSDFAWLNYWKYFVCESQRTSWSRLFCKDYRF